MEKRLLLLALFFIQIAAAQTESIFTYNEYGWSITIPAGYNNVDIKEWEKLQGRGLNLMEDAYNTDLSEVVQPIETLKVVKKGQYNYLEVLRQDFDTAVDGDHEEVCRAVADVLVETFTQTMPGSKIEVHSGKEIISGKTFVNNRINVTFPNGMQFVANMYSCLIGKKEFVINIMYLDKEEGERLLNAFKNSTFK